MRVRKVWLLRLFIITAILLGYFVLGPAQTFDAMKSQVREKVLFKGTKFIVALATKP